MFKIFLGRDSEGRIRKDQIQRFETLSGLTQIDLNIMSQLIEKAAAQYENLLSEARSVQLGTVDPEGRPDISYAPVILDEARHLYIYISVLSKHTSNLLQTKVASAMLIEDEGSAEQLFARRRITYECQAEAIERNSEKWVERLNALENRFGGIIKGLRQLEDFHLICLRPRSGRLVVGFGQAFEVSGECMETLSHLGGSGQGHRKSKADKV